MVRVVPLTKPFSIRNTDGVGDVLGTADAADREPFGRRLQVRSPLIAKCAGDERGVDETGDEGVDPDRGELEGQRSRQRLDRGARRRTDGAPTTPGTDRRRVRAQRDRSAGVHLRRAVPCDQHGPPQAGVRRRAHGLDLDAETARADGARRHEDVVDGFHRLEHGAGPRLVEPTGTGGHAAWRYVRCARDDRATPAVAPIATAATGRLANSVQHQGRITWRNIAASPPPVVAPTVHTFTIRPGAVSTGALSA